MNLIEFATGNSIALEMFPPTPAKKIIPDWYKEMDLYRAGVDPMDAKQAVESGSTTPLTVKGCPPVLDYLTSGYMLLAHSDTLITPQLPEDKEGIKNWYWRSNAANVSAHSHSQCPIKINGFKNEYFKWSNPWVIKTPKGYSCYFYQPEFFLETRFKFFPGIVDTDGYNSEAVHFPGVILSNEPFVIKAGTPIMVVFPFKREDWSSKARLLTENEKHRINPVYAFLEKGYKTLFHKKKSYQ